MFNGKTLDYSHKGLKELRKSIGQLMEILKDRDGFEFKDTALTISEARKVLKHWKGTQEISKTGYTA